MKRNTLAACAAATLLPLTACAADEPEDTSTPEDVDVVDSESEPVEESEPDAVDSSGELANFAMVFPGSIQDADYNAAGFGALEFVGEEFGVETEFSESVDVVDVERVTRDYLDRGFDVVSLHGGQFLTVALELAPEFPDSVFIVQAGGPLEDAPENVWNIGRPYYEGFYILGALAAEASETRSVAFLGGLEIPLFKAGANAFFEGARSVDPEIDLQFTFSGDQSDAVTNRQATEALIGAGADVIVTSVNDGIFGVSEAVGGADRKVLFTSLTSDKVDIDPEHYLAGINTDFNLVYSAIVQSIIDGETSGYFPQEVGNGQSLTDVYNVDDDDIVERVRAIEAAIESGEIVVEDDQGDVVIPEVG